MGSERKTVFWRSIAALVLALTASYNAWASASDEPSIGDGHARFVWETFARLNAPVEGCATEWECWMTREYLFETCEPEWEDALARDRQLMPLTQEESGVLDHARTKQLPLEEIERLQSSLEETLQDIRMNRRAFEWIDDHQLRLLEKWRGLYLKYCCESDYVLPRTEFTFGSMFVEASWKPIDSEQKDKYHTIEDPKLNGQLLGLVGLHLSSKIFPNWLWATWEHVDNPHRVEYGIMRDPLIPAQRYKIFVEHGLCQPDPEASEEDDGLKDCVWTNYELNGVQVSFMDRKGNPMVLSNSVFETSNPDSSCMSCHARSTIGAEDTHLELFRPRSLGLPDPSWFDGAPFPSKPFLQMDFVNFLRDVKTCEEICGDGSSHCVD